MIDSTNSSPFLRRAATEHRRLLVALAVASAANVLIYALLVYPLSQRFANVEQRDQAAGQALAQARTERALASSTVAGKALASAELATFYSDVLPQDLASARRLTYLRLARLAQESGLRYERASYDPDIGTGSTLTRLRIQMLLSGTYSDVRDFIFKLETAAEFVVIDNMQLAQGGGGAGSLIVTLDMSTYYRDGVSP